MEAVNPERTRRLELLSHSLGDVIRDALNDPDVVEISLNDDGKIWVERNGEAMCPAGTLAPADGLRIISLVADALGQVVTVEVPILEGEFPLDGSRFEGMIPPVVRAPVFSLRKHSPVVIPLQEYVNSGAMPVQVLEIIKEALVKKWNILVSGGTGSGKTTLINGIIAEMAVLCPDARLSIMEDTRELQSCNPNTVYMRSTVYVPMPMLVKANMRMRPDRMIMGEVRGQEAFDLLGSTASEKASQVRSLLSSPTGRMQAIQAGNQLTAMQLQEAQELRMLLATAVQEQAVVNAKQEKISQAEQEHMRQVFRPRENPVDPRKAINSDY